MALIPTFEVSIDKEESGYVLNVEDTTGAYSASNLGGYGTPNPLRVDIALIILAYYKKVDGDIAVEFVSYNPLTVTIFQGTYQNDGYYQFKIFAIDKVTVYPGSPDEDDVVYYNPDADTIILSKYDGSDWIEIEEVDLLDLPTTGLTIATNNEFPLVNIGLYKHEKNRSIPDEFFGEHKCTPEIEAEERAYDIVYHTAEGATNDFCNENYAFAQKTIENLLNWIDEGCNC